TFLDWITAGPFGASAWADHARYQIADVINVTSPIDAIVVLVVAGLGAFLLLGPAFGKSMPVPPWLSTVAGVALVVLGIVEIFYIQSLNDKLKKLGAGG